jgi:hypothetical protein
MSRITVHVQVGAWPSNSDVTVAMELDRIQRDSLQQLDLPSASPGFFCTPSHVVRRVMIEREVVAEEITNAILKALGQRDLIDGYPKEHSEEAK